MHLLSIIVPVYNVEKYLSDCIKSILNQTYRDFELILIDDGSTDSSGKICDEYSKKDRFFVNCSGLTYNHMRERTLVLSFLMFKVISIFVLKLSKFLNPKACRLISLMSLLVASSLALE